MHPDTTEDKLKSELENFQQNLECVRLKIKSLQTDLDRLQTNLMQCRLEVSNKTEELRMFRIMYPNICSPPGSK